MWNFLEWLSESQNQSKAAIVTVLGGALGFCLTKVYDRFLNDKFVSEDMLLEKLNRQTVSNYGKRRLKDNLSQAIRGLQDKFKKPAEFLRPDITTIQTKKFCVLSSEGGAGMCIEDSKNNFVFYYATTDYMQDLIYDLNLIKTKIDQDLQLYFNNNSTDKKLFDARTSIDNSISFTFWLYTPNLSPSNHYALLEAYQCINLVLGHWFTNCHLIIELFISDDLKVQEDLCFYPKSIHIGRKELSYNYTLLRNNLYNLFKEGYIFGTLNCQHEPLPPTLVDTRMNDLMKQAGASLINIWGVPGCGKTYLSQEFIQTQLQSSGGVFLILRKAHLIQEFVERIITNNSRADFYKSLVDVVMDGNYSLLPPLATSTRESQILTRFVLENLLNAGNTKFHVVTDDYYLHKETLSKTFQTIFQNRWGVKFILIGRPKIEDFKGNVAHYECLPWTRDEAKSIINLWTGKINSEIEKLLTLDWLATENNFSIYLMRLIVRNVDDIKEDRSISSVLRKEIIDFINPFYETLLGKNSEKQLSYPELIKAFESLISEDGETIQKSSVQLILNKRTNITIDAFIDKMGELSWASRFQVAEANDKQINKELIERHLPFVEPDMFTSLATEANILDSDSSKYKLTWKDNLIADGCLAINICRNLNAIKGNKSKYQQFSGILEGLRQQYSLNILSLVLEKDDLLELTKIVCSTNLERIDIIGELLTEVNINKLKKADKFDSLVEILKSTIKDGSDERYLLKLSFLVKKLADLESKFRNYLEAIIGREHPLALVAAHVLCQENIGQSKYYEICDQNGMDKYISTNVSIINWDANIYTDILFQRLNQISKTIEPENIYTIWTAFIDRLHPDKVERVLNSFFKDVTLQHRKQEFSILQAIGKSIRGRKTTFNKITIIDTLRTHLISCYEKSLYGFCGDLVKSIVAIENSKLFHENIDWTVDTTGKKLAFPIEPYGPNIVSVVAAAIPVDERYNIIKERHALVVHYCPLIFRNAFELISDNYTGHISNQISASNFKAVNWGSKPYQSKLLTREEVLTKNIDSPGRYYWRPQYEFNRPI